jgi:hypothetical protein
VFSPHPGPAALPLGQRFSRTTSGVVVAQAEPVSEQKQGGSERHKGLPFDEETKLVYGVVFSLRNMVKKLSRTAWVLFAVMMYTPF